MSVIFTLSTSKQCFFCRYSEAFENLVYSPAGLDCYSAETLVSWSVAGKNSCSLFLQFSEGDHLILWAVGNF